MYLASCDIMDVIVAKGWALNAEMVPISATMPASPVESEALMLSTLGSIVERVVSLIFVFIYANNYLFSLFIRFTTTFTMMSFSSVRLSAIIRVRATRVLSAMRLRLGPD